MTCLVVAEHSSGAKRQDWESCTCMWWLIWQRLIHIAEPPWRSIVTGHWRHHIHAEIVFSATDVWNVSLQAANFCWKVVDRKHWPLFMNVCLLSPQRYVNASLSPVHRLIKFRSDSRHPLLVRHVEMVPMLPQASLNSSWGQTVFIERAFNGAIQLLTTSPLQEASAPM